MNLTEGLLVVIVIILVFVIVARPRASKTSSTKTWDCVDRNTGDITSVEMKYLKPDGACKAGCACPKCATPEGNAQAETVEHFQGCMNGPKLLVDGDSCDGTFDYAVNEYGAPGMSYRDWIGTQAVDPAVVKNHAEFVKDRVGNDWKQFQTGRTYALPDHESYQPTKWIGIRGRPTRVAVCNPTEVTDDATEFYPASQKVTWKS